MIVWAEDAYDEAVAHTMGLVTFSLFHVFFSLETADEERTIFSSELLENPILLKTSGLSPADDLPRDDVRAAPAAPRHGRADAHQWAICIVLPASIIVITEVRKVFRRRSAGRAAEAPTGGAALASQPS